MFEIRADLARYLGVCRGRVTQVLRKLANRQFEITGILQA